MRDDRFLPFEYGRRDPLLGIGDEDKNAQHVYDSPKLNGLMKPHVFARLRNISFHAMFVIPKTTLSFIHKDLDKNEEDKFTEYIGRTNIIRSFVKMTSLSSTITRLNVHLGFQVNPFFPGVCPSDFPYLSKDEFEKLQFAHDSRCIIAARRRATELFVDSGALDPLYGLDNVKYFSLDFTKGEGEQELPQKLLDTAQDMKLSIERRYLARKL